MTLPSFSSLRIEERARSLWIILNRPETRNAFDEVMIAEIHQAVDFASEQPDIRAIVLTGEGTAFSAGANISWMERMGEADFETNYRDALGLANMLDALDRCPIPTIARVNGPAIGGGTGLVAACDIATAVDTAFFTFSEVKIGLVPACIAPYVLRKVGLAKGRELFITGRKMLAAEGRDSGLINFLAGADKLDEEVESLVAMIGGSGPKAVASAKCLVRDIPNLTRAEYIDYTARLIAELRTSSEGREGTRAFLEKRKPNWS